MGSSSSSSSLSERAVVFLVWTAAKSVSAASTAAVNRHDQKRPQSLWVKTSKTRVGSIAAAASSKAIADCSAIWAIWAMMTTMIAVRAMEEKRLLTANANESDWYSSSARATRVAMRSSNRSPPAKTAMPM